jgi:glutathione S-transferase
LIAAEINHVEIIVETEDIERIAKEKSPTGQLPILELLKTTSTTSTKSQGVIFSSAAIARYIAGLRTDTNLMGDSSSFLERAAVNQWVDWCGAELELPSCLLVYPIVGYMTVTDPEMYVQINGRLAEYYI